MTDLELLGARAKDAARVLAATGTDKKNAALASIARALRERTPEILEANAKDMKSARESGMRDALLDRLLLTESRIEGVADGVLEVMALPDPIGQYDRMSTRPNGLTIGQKRVPLGVIAFIYESRPNVTVDGAVLCLKSGNAVILRGGKEAYNSNLAFMNIMRGALLENGLPEECASLVSDLRRESATELMNLTGYVDLLVPRGSSEARKNGGQPPCTSVFRGKMETM